MLDELLVSLSLAKSRSEAKRLIEQGGVKVDDSVITDWKQSIATKKGTIVQAGKRNFIQID